MNTVVVDESRVGVTILDKEYQVACKPEERHALMQAADELDHRMRAVRKSGSIVGLERIAIMVALNLCHELQHTKPLQSDAEFDEALERIESKIEKTLDKT